MAYSRPELEAFIDKGECVIVGGRAITKKEDLPSAIELAGNDIVKKAHALGDLEAAKEALQKQIDAAKAESVTTDESDKDKKPGK